MRHINNETYRLRILLMGQSHLILGGEKVIDLKNRVPHPVWDSETIRSVEWQSGTSLGPLTTLVETSSRQTGPGSVRIAKIIAEQR